MAQSASSISDSQAAYLLQLTCVAPQQRSSARQASAPSLDVRNIRITKRHLQCYIGRKGSDYTPRSEPASDNAYFADEALEMPHALLTLNDEGELCIKNTALLGGVSINGEMLQSQACIVLPPSSEILLTRIWNPVMEVWRHRFTLKAIICPNPSAPSSIGSSSTACAQKQRLSRGCADIEAENSPDAVTCGRKSQFDGAPEQSLIPRGAKKRLRSQDVLQNDSLIPSGRSKVPRLASCPDVHRWQESVSSGPPLSQRHHNTTPWQGSLPDSCLTRSSSGSAVSCRGSPTRTELRNRPRLLDLLSNQAKEELVMSLLAGLLCGGIMPSDLRASVYPFVKALVRLMTSSSTSDTERT